jgi:hypothetical protein
MYFTSKFVHFNPLRGELIWKTKVGEPASSWIGYSGFCCVGCTTHCACWYRGPGALKISVIVWKTDPSVQDRIKLYLLKKNTFQILSDSPTYKCLGCTPSKKHKT